MLRDSRFRTSLALSGVAPVLGILALLAVVDSSSASLQPTPGTEGVPARGNAVYEVTGVSAKDGDSVVVRFPSGLEVEVRLLSIDAPERGQALSEDALEFTRASTVGKALRLSTQKEERDRYRRLLATVVVEGRNLNLELLRRGLAVAYVRPPNTDGADEILSAQREAYESRRGLWGLHPPPEDPRSARARRRDGSRKPVPLRYEFHQVVGNRRSKVAHWPGCAHVLQMSPQNRHFLESVERAKRLGFRMEKGYQ